MSKIKTYVVPTITLFLICLVSAFLLGLTNEATKGTIEANDLRAKQEAQKSVLPEGVDFSEEGENEFGSYAVAKDADGKTVGYAVTATGKGGYGGDIDLMVGIDNEGVVQNISFLSIEETPSIGMKLKSNMSFLKQLFGLSGSAALTKNGGTVIAVTGATKTSTGITNAVDNALHCYSIINGEVKNDG